MRELLFDTEARNRLIQGVDKLANAVKVTLGAKGKHVIIARQNQLPSATKDGVTVAAAVQLSDAVENAGANIIYQAAHMTAYEAGDGTTTSTVLAQELIRLGNKAAASGVNPVFIKEGYELGLELTTRFIKQQAQAISTEAEASSMSVQQIATIAANGDPKIGELIAEAVGKIGPEGLIHIGESKGQETEISIINGLRIANGWVNWHFITNVGKKTSELDNPYILIYEKKVNSAQDLYGQDGIMEQVHKTGRPLLILAEDIEGEALASMIQNKANNRMLVCAVKLPGAGEARKELLEDIAASTGATVTGPERGIKLSEIKLQMLGQAAKVSVSKEETIVHGAEENKERTATRIAQLQSQLIELPETETNATVRAGIQERISRLSGGIAIIHVGGSTDIEIRAARDLVDDAIRATQSALKEGIVTGGGNCLLYISEEIRNDAVKMKNLHPDTAQALISFAQALTAPVKQIATNAGENAGFVVKEILAANNPLIGYNARTGKYEDLQAAGVIDAAKVTRCAIQNATSVAIVLLTSDCAIVDSLPEVHHGQ